MPTEHIIIPLCREVLIVYGLLFLLNIDADNDKTVCETIYPTASFQICTFCSKCAIWNTCFRDELNFIRPQKTKTKNKNENKKVRFFITKTETKTKKS